MRCDTFRKVYDLVSMWQASLLRQVAVDSVERVADVLTAVHALVTRRREKATGAKLLRQLCRPEMRVEVRDTHCRAARLKKAAAASLSISH